jgi:integrase
MIVEVMVTIETSIKSLAAQLQNETLKDILARDTVDRLTLTFRTHVLSCHYADPLIERAAGVKPSARSRLRGWPGVPASIFTTSTGKPVPESDVRRVLARSLAVAQVARHHTPHSFRHTFASLLLNAGESIQFVQQALGHSDIKLTVNTYGKWLPAKSLRGGVDGLDGGSRENGGKVVGEPFPLTSNVVDLFPVQRSA